MKGLFLLVFAALGAASAPALKAYRIGLSELNDQLPFLELRFEHPPAVRFRAEEEHVIEAPGLVGLHLSGALVGRGGREDDTLVLVTFFDLARLKEFRDAFEDPEGFVRKAASHDDDPYLGVVGPAEGLGVVEPSKGAGFVVAERTFRAVSSKTKEAYSGRLLELLFTEERVEARVQMAGRDPKLLERVRDAFLRSVRLGPSKRAAEASQTGPMHVCRSDRDCWCRVFTGAEFVAGRNPWYCDETTGRCRPCTYE